MTTDAPELLSKEGSELSLDGVSYRVIAIDKQPGALGRVRQEALS